MTDAITTDEAEALKSGARHSAFDQRKIQEAHDALAQCGAVCAAGEHSEHGQEGADVDGNYPMKGVQRGTNPVSGTDAEATYAIDPSKYLVAPGGAIKALGQMPDGGLRVGGYLVRFGSADKTDISAERDYFTKDTDFGDAKSSDVYYNHRMPVVGKDGEEIIVRRRFGKGALSVDDVGVFIEAVTFNRDAYEQVLNNGIKATLDKHGWSSGTAAHLVDRETQPNGANWIRKWPLGLDASLTPTPAEPDTSGVIPLKSLSVGNLPPGWETLVNAPDGARADTKSSQPTTPLAGGNMPTELEQVLGAISGLSTTVTTLSTQLQTQATDIAALKSKVNEPQLPPATTPNIPEGAVKGNMSDFRDLGAEKGFDSLGEQFVAIKAAAYNPSGPDKRLLHINSIAAKATGASEAGTEGFLIQREFVNDMQTRMYNTGVILSGVTRRPIGPGANGLIVNTINETSRADGSRFGGVRAYWLNEGGTKTQSRPTFRRFTINLEKLAGLYYATDELLGDVTALGGEVSDMFYKELQFAAEDAIYEGNGTGKPLGLMSAPALVSVAKETNQAAATVNFANMLKMWNRLWAPLRQGAVWLIHQDVEPQLQQLALPVGTAALEPRFISYGPDGILRAFGRPVIPVEYASTVGTQGDIMLTNLSEYRWIEKGGIEGASSIHVQFVTDETAFRWVWRVNGAPFWNSALTPFKGSNSLSHVVVLDTRS